MRPVFISHLRQFVCAAAVLAAVVGCASGPTPPVTPPPINSPVPAPSVAATPVPSVTASPHFTGGSIIIAGIGQPSREVTSLPRFISDALYDSLLRIDPSDGSLKPGLAATWQVSEDARTFTFHLRPGVRWHDGQALDAQDVVYTIQSLSAPDLRLATPAADFGTIAQVSAPDAVTVVVRLKDPYCPALTGIGTLKILPQHVIGTPAPSTQSGGGPTGAFSLTPEQFVGTGPLVLKTWNSDSITFSANSNYWNGPPAITDWTYRIFANLAEARAALASGQADVLELEAEQAVGNQAPAGSKTLTRNSERFYSLAIEQEQGVFADGRVRQALAFALDRSVLASDLFGKDAPLMQTSTLPGFWATPTNAAQPAYDQARAKQLLAEAGWVDADGDGVLDKDGKPLKVTLWAAANDPVDEPLAFEVRDMLARVGFQVLLQLDDRDEMLTRLFLHEFDLAVASWNIPLDPDQHWYWQSTENKPGEGLNFVSYSSRQVDDLLTQGISAAGCDAKARSAIYAQVYRTISNDIPQVFLFAPPAYVETRTRIFGPEPSPFAGDFWNLTTWQAAP